MAALNEQNTGLALTANGQAAFPGLTNGDLSAGLHHNRFENTGDLKVLAASTSTNSNLILGSAGGSITNPKPPGAPEPGTLAPVGAAVFGLWLTRKLARRKQV